MRTTKVELQSLVDYLNQLAKSRGLPAYRLQFAFGYPRLFQDIRIDGQLHEAALEISPRLPMGQLADWIRAYAKGIAVALEPVDDEPDHSTPEDPAGPWAGHDADTVSPESEAGLELDRT